MNLNLKLNLFSKTLLLTLVFVCIPFTVGCFEASVFAPKSDFSDFEASEKIEDTPSLLYCGFQAPKDGILRRQPSEIVRCHDTLYYTLDVFCPKLPEAEQIEAARNGLQAWAYSLFNVLRYTEDSDKAFLHFVFADTGDPIPPLDGYVMNNSAGFAYYPPSNPSDTIHANNGYAYLNNKVMRGRYLTNMDSLAWFFGHEGGHALGLPHNDDKGNMMFYGLYDQGPASNLFKGYLREGYDCRKGRSFDFGLDLVSVKDTIPLGLVLVGFGG